MQIAGEMLRAIDAFCLCAKLSSVSSLKGTVRTGVCACGSRGILNIHTMAPMHFIHNWTTLRGLMRCEAFFIRIRK